MTDKSKQVPASATIIPFVTFPGMEIKDLYVHETTAPAPAATPAPAPQANNKSENKQKHEKPKPKHDSVTPPKPPTAHEEKAAAQKNTPAPAAAPAATPAAAPTASAAPAAAQAQSGA